MAAALLLAFGVAIGLVIYFSVKPTGQVENKDVASGPRKERDGPSRLLDERRWNPETPTLSQSAEAAPAEVASKPHRAAKALDERMEHLSATDMEDVRALLGMTDKPEAVQIGLKAVKHRGPKAKEMLPDLLKRISEAKGQHKLELALAIAAIDAEDYKVAKSVIPILVAALRPETENEKPSKAVLKAIAAIGEPVVDEIFKALEAAEGIGNINANNRKALLLALERLGSKAYSERNLRVLREYRGKERYRDVQEAATRALKAMQP